MRTPSEIFKIQRPLASNDPNVGLLVYNKSRGIFVELHDQELLNKFGIGDKKIYVNGYMDGLRFVFESFASQVQDW